MSYGQNFNLPFIHPRSLVSQVPAGYLRSLVEEIRSSTSVSYATSHQVSCVLVLPQLLLRAHFMMDCFFIVQLLYILILMLFLVRHL